MTVFFENETDEAFLFSPQEQVKVLVQAVCGYFKCPYETEISILLVSEDTIRKMNREFRAIDRKTDVLSFPMSDFRKPSCWTDELFLSTQSISPETNELLLGDIVLCPEIIKRQAKEYGHSEEREFSFLVVHSLLHLLGFDHQEEKERLCMEEKQKDILNRCHINR